MARKASPVPPSLTPPPPHGEVQLVVGADHFRRVIVEGMLRATVSLDIATADFKAMLVPHCQAPGFGSSKSVQTRRFGGRGRGRSDDGAVGIVDVLRTLAQRGVEVRLLHSGVPTTPALRALKQLPANLKIRRCPRLHAKAVVVDCRSMYLGSANLTGAGLGAKGEHKRNFEMGVWTTSTALIDGVLSQFNALWEGQPCGKCRRKNICPVPLEEPALE